MNEEADACFGSRTMIKGAARRGGMPLYKFVGEQGSLPLRECRTGTDLSEFHSGYRAYSVAALKQLPFEKNSNGFNFDTQIIIQMHDAGMRIAEVPIPTYYGDEICYVDGMGYAADVTKDVITYRFKRLDLVTGVVSRSTRNTSSRPATTARTDGYRSCCSAARPAGSSISDARAACCRSGCDAWGTTCRR